MTPGTTEYALSPADVEESRKWAERLGKAERFTRALERADSFALE